MPEYSPELATPQGQMLIKLLVSGAVAGFVVFILRAYRFSF